MLSMPTSLQCMASESFIVASHQLPCHLMRLFPQSLDGSLFGRMQISPERVCNPSCHLHTQWNPPARWTTSCSVRRLLTCDHNAGCCMLVSK